MLPNPDMFGPATFALGQSVSAFTTFLPKFSDVRKASPADNPDLAADVRMGEIAAVTVSVGIGAIASSLTGSPVPVIVTLIVCLVLVVLYESTLTSTPVERKNALYVVREAEAHG